MARLEELTLGLNQGKSLGAQEVAQACELLASEGLDLWLKRGKPQRR